jgi:hypothetical protein
VANERIACSPGKVTGSAPDQTTGPLNAIHLNATHLHLFVKHAQVNCSDRTFMDITNLIYQVQAAYGY